MTNLLEFEKNGVSIFIEVNPAQESGITPMGADETRVEKATQTLQASLEMISQLGEGLSDALKRTGAQSGEIKLGLKLTGEGKLFVVKTAGEATLNLKLTYRHSE